MATPVNEFDLILQAETSRTLASGGSALILSTTANTVFVDAAGAGTPAVINMVATPINAIGTIAFSASPAVTFSVDASGKIVTLQQTAMGTSDVTITATLTTPNGLVYSDAKTVKRVTIGTLGYTGALNATVNNTAQGLLANRPAGNNGDFYFATDTLTLYQKLAGAWVAASTIGANASNFTGIVGGDNLCPNSSFDIVSNGTLADGWAIYNTYSAGEPTNASMWPGRTGGNAQAIAWSNSHTYAKGVMRSGAVPNGWVAGATYIVSFYAKSTNISNNTAMMLGWNTNPATTTPLMNPNLTTAWARYAFKIVWGASVEATGGLFVSAALGAGAGNVIIDDLMIVEGDVLPAYYPSTAEAKAAADTANAAISNISSDSILSKGEKSDIVLRWQTADSEWASLIGQADALGVSRTAFNTAHQNLSDYLLSLSPGWSDTTQDTAIDPTTWKAKWNAYYDEKQKLINALAAKSATMSTWAGTTGPNKPEDSANFTPLSKGMALNEDPAIEKPSAWALTGNTTITGGAGGTNVVGDKYFRSTAAVLDSKVDTVKQMTVDPAKTYLLTANLYQDGASDRAMFIYVNFYDASGTFLGNAGWGGTMSGYVYGALPSAGWSRQGGQFGAGTSRAIPASARTCAIGVWFHYSGGGANTSAVQAAQDIRLEPVISQSMIDASFSAVLADRMSKTARNILSGSGGTVAGTLTWDATGAYTGGYGVAMTQKGILGYNSGGGVTFTIDAGTGAATFGGTLAAPSGTLGSVHIPAGGGVHGGDYTSYNWPTVAGKLGFYLGPEGLMIGDKVNNKYFNVDQYGNMWAPGFTLVNGQLTLTGPVISSPSMTGVTLDSFTVSITGSAGGNFANNVTATATTYGTLSAVPSGGRSPYTYAWGREVIINGTAKGMLMTSPTAQSVTLSGFGSNTELDYNISCTVTDANGRSVTAWREVDATHGSP